MIRDVLLAKHIVETSLLQLRVYLLANTRENHLDILLLTHLAKIREVVNTRRINKRNLAHANHTNLRTVAECSHHLLKLITRSEEERTVDLVNLHTLRNCIVLQGLGNTLIITFFAIILSVILGTLIAIVRARHERKGDWKIPNMICQLYLTIMRGTPTMVQLLIIYYVVFASADVNKIFVAVIAFGLNSAAYIAEVIRSGIMSVDNGQMEAGRSLGLSYGKTMRLIILPQAFKNVLPAMGNELITLLKETSISGYIGLVDLTKGSDIIRSITYEAMMPLGVVALVYLFLVLGLNAGVRKLEKRLRKSERK